MQQMQNLGQGGPPLASYIGMQHRQISNNQTPGTGMMGPPSLPGQFGSLQYPMQQNGVSTPQQQMMQQMQSQQQQQQQQAAQHLQVQQLLQQQQRVMLQQQAQQHQQHQQQPQGLTPQQQLLNQMQQSMPHQQMQGLHQQMSNQSNTESPSMKKKPRPMPPARQSHMAPPAPVPMRSPMYMPTGPQSGDLEPYADEFDYTLPQDLAIARFEMRHNALNEIFSPERHSQLPEPDDQWNGKPLDDLEVDLAAMEEAYKKLQRRADTEVDDLRARLEKVDRGETLTPVSSPEP